MTESSPVRSDEERLSDDAQQVIHVTVTNLAGVSFPAVLVGTGFSKAGVVSFYVEPDDAPPGERSGERCEPFRAFADGRPFYTVTGHDR